MNPADILTMSNEQLEQLYWQTCQEEEDIVAQKVAIKVEFMDRLKKIKRDGLIIGDTSITKFNKAYFSKVTIETARELAAVKVEEKVDSTKLNKLVKAGATIQGVEIREELRITRVEKEDA